MDNEIQTLEDDALEEIAVIGLAGRFPGGPNLEHFWQNLFNGIECITHFSNEELANRGIPREWLNHPDFVKSGTVLENFDKFDAAFFGYSPVEAESIDPQQRIFLETAWEALEIAGYNPQTYDGPIGVFAGSNPNHYQDLLPANNDCRDVAAEMERLIGNEKDFLCTRVSYKLNLNGPSLTVQTGCSTALVAVHLACQNLLNYQCSMALAGGVSINLKQCSGYFFQDGTIVCPDGHCRAFDAKAQGTVLGQGVGIVVLKRLSEALADGDAIYAVIKATAINNDGALKAGFTAPSVDGQAEVIAMAHALAGVSADTIGYIEAHGTGTSLGDPIEIAALTQAFRASTTKNGFCAIGSVKTNIGHADAAAGIAGLIKSILMLHHKKVPPSLHFDQPNPNIDFENSPFYVPTQPSDWTLNGFPRRAGVSSFGIGGTNVHAVLEEAPDVKGSGPSRSWQLFLLSAHTSTALKKLTADLHHHLNTHPELQIADVAYTLNTGRKTQDYRRAIVCQTTDDSIAMLTSGNSQHVLDAYQEPTQRNLVFLLTGQGSQYVNMGLGLYQGEVVFREAVDRCCDGLRSHLGLDLRQILYPSGGETADVVQQLRQTSIAQPALFTIEYALAQLWMSWGVHPEAMVGHSIGEYVAGCLAEVFSLEDALLLVAARGRLMQQLPAGSMLAVSLSESEIEGMLGGELSLAAVNAPGLCVVSGENEAIDAIERQLAQEDVGCTRLHTSHAFHSKMMEPILAEFADELGRVQLNAPQIPIMSNTSGSWMGSEEAQDRGYWVRHLRQAVRFCDSIRELTIDSSRVLLEVGPGHTLCTLSKQSLEDPKGHVVLSSIRHPKEDRSDVEFILTTLGRLWLAGVEVNWEGFYGDEKRHRVPLPTYPFQRQRFWPAPLNANLKTSSDQKVPAVRGDQGDWFSIPSWKRGRPLNPSSDKGLAAETFSWLIFLDECGVGAELSLRLTSAGHRVTTVTAGNGFELNMPSDYTINPKDKENYAQLLNSLRLADQSPYKIVHLWCLNRGTGDPSEEDRFRLSRDLGFNSLLFLAQAIGDQLFDRSLEIKVISNNLYDVTGDEVLVPQKALLLGPCRVIPHEYPNVRCSNIDLVLPQGEISQAQTLLAQLLDEITAPSEDFAVAYRGKHRWLQFFEPLGLEELTNRPVKVRTGGVYVITGGLGGIGLALAEHLAQNFQAKLVLVARTELPDRDQWPHWLNNRDEHEAVSDKIENIMAIEHLGGVVLTVAADVTDADQMSTVTELAIGRFGQIDGVIHAAGLAGGGIMQLKTAEAAAEIFAPKIKGLQTLMNCFQGMPLDFFVLCSALSALFGEAGQVDYCAANAVLDAYARKYHAKYNMISLDWGTWKEIGMAVNTELPADLKAVRERNLNLGIAPEQGKKAFNQGLTFFMPQVVVSPPELFRRFETGTLVVSDEDEGESEEASAGEAAHSRPELSSVYVVPGNATEKAIAEIWQKLLKIDNVGVHDNFFDLGGHSLLATRLIAQLRNAFPIEFTMADLFERPTVHSLSELVLEQEKGVATFAESKDRGQRRKEKRLQRVNPRRNRIAREEFESL